MRMHQSFRWLRCGVLAAGLAAVLSAGATAQVGDIGVHDPVLIREADTYYMFSTGIGVDIRRSPDLVHWERAGRVLDPIPAWAMLFVPGYTGHTWAPDIQKVGDRYCLYYSCSTFASHHSAIGLATNTTLNPDDPEYRWVDQGVVVYSTDESDNNAIDPNLIQDVDGRYYLSWGSFWTGIKMTEIDLATGKPTQDPPRVFTIAARGPERGSVDPMDDNAIEAPFIMRKGDWFYLFVSWDLCCRGANSNYRLMVGRAERATGPYVDFNGRDLRMDGGTLVLAGYGPRVHGPGHNGILQDGDNDWLVHHMYDREANYRPTGQIRPLRWTDDGWPVVGGAITRNQIEESPIETEDVLGTWTLWEDYDTSMTLRVDAGGRALLGTVETNWTLDGDRLRLESADADGAAAVRLFVDNHGQWLAGRRSNGEVLYAERPTP